MLQIPGYRLLERIGAGASGTVFRAEQTDLSRQVALKILAPGLFRASEVRARFLREAKVQAKLSHPNLVALFDADIADGAPYLVAEYVAGGTLRGTLERGLLEPEDALRLALGMASGLACAHAAGIVHRDLKPENVLLSEDGEPKIADFGLAKRLSGEGTLHTASGMILGTPGYLAPEAILGREAGTPADVYALGVLMAEMLSGATVFGGENVGEILQRQLAADGEDALASLPNLGRPLRALIAACLRKDPALRPSAEQVEAQLTALLERTSEWITDRSSVRKAASPGATQALPARTIRGARTSPAATVMKRSVSPEPANKSPAPRRAAWLAAACCVALAASLFVFRARPAPSRPGPGPVKEESKVPPTPSLAPATLFRVAAGSRAVRIWLDRPTPEPLELTLTRAGQGPPWIVRFPAGHREELKYGLETNSTYSLEQRIPGGTKLITFNTMGTVWDADTVQIAGSQGIGEQLALAATGPVIAAAWSADMKRNSRRQTVEFRQSPDGGSTWEPVRSLSEGAATISNLNMVSTGAGFAAAWLETEKDRVRGILRLKPTTEADWSAPVVLDTVSPGPALCKSEPGKCDLVTVRKLPAGEDLLRWQRLDGRVSPAEAPRLPLPALARDAKLLRLQWERGRSYLLAVTGDSQSGSQFQVSWSEGPDRWRSWVPVGPIRKSTPFIDFVVSGGRATLFTVWSGQREIYWSPVGSNDFRSVTLPSVPEWEPSYPSLVQAGANYYACSILYSPPSDSFMQLFSSTDELAWKLLPRFRIPNGLHRSVRLIRSLDRLCCFQLTMDMGLFLQTIPLR